MLTTLPAYRRITRDFESYDGDIFAALISAQKVVERKTDRFWESKEYTETLTVHEDGRAYPRGYPLTSVSIPQDASIDGIAIKVASNIFDDILINWPPQSQPQSLQVKYIGGYEPEDAPEEIVKAICEIAKLSLQDSSLVNIPSGATSVSVGDVSFSSKGPLSEIVIPGAIAATLVSFRRKEL